MIDVRPRPRLRAARAHRVRPADRRRGRPPAACSAPARRRRPSSCTTRAVWRALLRGGQGLAETYVDGLWDSPDVTAVIEVAARNLHGIDEIRRRADAGARAVAARPRAARAQHAAALARGHRRPLRPRQRPVRADARRDDDVLGRDLRAPRHDARRGVAGQARPHLRQARPRAVRPRARDRDRLGRVRAARRRDARLPRDDHHAVARAARAGAGAGARGRASRTA